MPTSDPKPYQWDFDGACAPTGNGYRGMLTFTLGIFQWVPKTGGKGLKRGKVVKRVKGVTGDPEPAYAKAREIVAKMNVKESPDV